MRYWIALASCLAVALPACGVASDLPPDGDLGVPATDAVTACGGARAAVGAVASAAQDGNPAAQATDGDVVTRWSGLGVGATLTLDLGAVGPVCGVSIAWYNGASRRNHFALAFSADGTTFTQGYAGDSSGTTAGFETYAVPATTARYVRLTVNGNTTNEWASVSEIRVAGGDAFVLGTTVPDATNTGVRAGVARTAYTGPSVITTPNQTFRDLDFNTIITVRAANITFENCLFKGGAAAPTSNTALVDVRHAAVSNVVFDRCTFSPTDPSIWTNAVIGHHFTARRCLTEHVVDGFGVYNTSGPDVAVHLEGNLMRDFSWYSDDYPNHTDGTHNDGVQLQGGRGLWVVGNSIRGYRWSEGNRETPPTPQIGNIVLTQQNTGYPVGDVHVNNNFVWGGANGLIFRSQRGGGAGGGYAGYAVEARNNVWMDDDQQDYGGSLHFYTVRPDSNIAVNGRTYPTTGGTDDAYGNRYAAATVVDASRRGLPAKVRCDAVPAP